MIHLAAMGRVDRCFALTAYIIKQEGTIRDGANCTRFAHQVEEEQATWLAIQQCLTAASGLAGPLVLIVNCQSVFDSLAGLAEPEGIDISHIRRVFDELGADVRLDYKHYPTDDLVKLLEAARLSAAAMAGKKPTPVQKLALELRARYSQNTIEHLSEELILPTY
jgi:hypothetical protein